eukprot:TRINITY_DN64344_c1_g1_i1.p5 TRINITY_DN64344_c1_g1~~TRINITY_DN64344_c1_g1_i1.p5  ORF type:complete len:236 (-),score=64.30 TRINITY_DN64344_c1_g1_i1:2034-2741(-)
MECIVCNIELKDMDHWQKHMNSLSHKDNVRNYSAKQAKEGEKKEEDDFEVPQPRKPIQKEEENKGEEEEEEVVEVEDVPVQEINSVLPQVILQETTSEKDFFDAPKEELKAAKELFDKELEKPASPPKKEPEEAKEEVSSKDEVEDRYESELLSNIDEYLYVHIGRNTTSNRQSKKQIEEMKKKGFKRKTPEKDRITESIETALSTKKKKAQEALKALEDIEEIQLFCKQSMNNA